MMKPSMTNQSHVSSYSTILAKLASVSSNL
jgi:hypothetical protein